MPEPRVLPVDRIPVTLWNNNTLYLPRSLSARYVELLDSLGLTEQSTVETSGSIHGGATAKETYAHFAMRFGVSAGRTEFAVLSPLESFSQLGNAFLTSFCEGHVAVLDIPCGTGATAGALISTLVELRRAGVMPRLPLTVTVCAGDFAPDALPLFGQILFAVNSVANEQGITVRYQHHHWDATRGDHTANLVDRWFSQCGGATEYFVLISNFSGALKTKELFDAFSPNLQQILSRLHDKSATFIWLEPKSNDARRGVFARLLDYMKRISWFKSRDLSAVSSELGADYEIEHPVSRKTFPTTVLVHQFKR